jgi:predicted AlkP superfamily phosphohydrolase/phosphomutase
VRFDDGETAFAVISDHGMPANKKAVSLVNLFHGPGWVTLTPDGQEVDWTRSKVFFAQNHLWISLKGRDDGGIVPPEEYHAQRSQVLAAMRDLKDTEPGEHVFAFVVPRGDAPMVGLSGEYIGDLVHCYTGGYR